MATETSTLLRQSHPRGYKYYLTATVAPEMIKKIDAIRGEVPRSRIIDRALSQYVERETRSGQENLVSNNK